MTVKLENSLIVTTPHVEKDGDKTFIGYSLYEEDDEPKLYYVEGYDL